MGDILTHKTISIDYLTHRQVKNKGLSVQYYIKDHHEPIISRELFHTVQTVLWDRYRCKKNTKGYRKNSVYLLRDIRFRLWCFLLYHLVKVQIIYQSNACIHFALVLVE